MNLTTAQGAITLLRTKSALLAAYESYAAGHDDKHRSANKAYGTNHASDDPNRPQGYYQKPVNKPIVLRYEMKSVWGQKPSLQPVMGTTTELVDITADDEKTMLYSAILSTTAYYLADAAADKFKFGCAIPSPFVGFTFEGGGRAFPKQPIPCDGMILVIATGSSNTQLVTHYPTSYASIQGQTRLT